MTQRGKSGGTRGAGPNSGADLQGGEGATRAAGTEGRPAVPPPRRSSRSVGGAAKPRVTSGGSPATTTGPSPSPPTESVAPLAELPASSPRPSEPPEPFGQRLSEAPPTSGPVRAWIEANALAPSPDLGRAPFRVPAELATYRTDPSSLPEQPEGIAGAFDLVGHVARRALTLGLSSREPSFHVFVSVDPQVMIEGDIVRFAERFAEGRQTPSDIVYVHDFDHPEAPRPLSVPPSAGPVFVAAMEALIERLRQEIPSLLQHEEVRKATQRLARDLDAKNREVLTGLESTAKTLGFGIRAIQGGVQTFPILHGKPLSSEQFGALDESTKRALGEAEERLTTEVEKAAVLVRAQNARFEAAREEAMSRLAEEAIRAACGDLRKALAELGDDVQRYLERVEVALIADWHDFVDPGPPTPGEGSAEEGADHGNAPEIDPEHAQRLSRFRVNLLVSHEAEAPPPVVYETNPTYPNLFGYLERRARFGALLTDFTRIRPGSLHRASGGVLVVRAADLMTDPMIWERVKRVLRERRIGAEDPLGPLGLYATTLRPVPVPIRVRVVLVGPPELYAALLEADADFAALFRVKVEIEPSIPRTPENLRALDAYLTNMAREREWGTFDRAARARLLDLATRLAGDRQKLSLSLAPLEETAAFASAIALSRAELPAEGAPPGSRSKPNAAPRPSTVTADDIEIAWRERRERAGAAERHIRELTIRGEVSLDTEGVRVGVVNGLSVYSAGDVEFGQPMRITAVVALGREGIVDVEHEAQLGGAIHTKGVAIIRGYLARMFGQERPLSLRAQIAFEQSYGEIDGDSASSSELFGVLSALAEVPIDQGIAVTGSVNQLGEIQAIGGVCAKIEGFFELCRARGLTGHQGVLLPRANLEHLVLRDDVARAIERGEFHLYAVSTVAQGIEVLTGVPAGERDPSGRFPAVSVFGRVERRIIEIAERLRAAEAPHALGAPPLDSMDDVSHADLSDAGDYRNL